MVNVCRPSLMHMASHPSQPMQVWLWVCYHIRQVFVLITFFVCKVKGYHVTTFFCFEMSQVHFKASLLRLLLIPAQVQSSGMKVTRGRHQL